VDLAEKVKFFSKLGKGTQWKSFLPNRLFCTEGMNQDAKKDFPRANKSVAFFSFKKNMDLVCSGLGIDRDQMELSVGCLMEGLWRYGFFVQSIATDYCL
jgi:hypothetical protein